MTRPKVPAELRQRTAQACESCKRRKQKCNGQCPCNTCGKRNFDCVYLERDGSPQTEDRTAKKRSISETGPHEQSAKSPKTQRHLNAGAQPQTPARGVTDDKARKDNQLSATSKSNTAAGAAAGAGTNKDHHSSTLSQGTGGQSGQEEEAVVYGQSRMLQDPTGRLLYVGDSAALSFLQLLRMMVENVAGPTPFTSDPNRHKIIESQPFVPLGLKQTNVLPDIETARILIDSFFVNTHGLIYLFDRDKFFQDLDQCYQDPLSADPSWLCLLNLMFAIGITLAQPISGSPEALVVDKLRSSHVDRAQVFYLNAKSLNDPIVGLEDQDFWAVQGLLLRAVYMLVKNKRNWAFSLVGMAARSAQALGLHREETMIIFSPEEQKARRNLWRSIFVLDRFFSCALGRPTAISEDDCSGDTLKPTIPVPQNLLDSHDAERWTGEASLEAAVRSCSTIGMILKRVYQQRKISTRLAQEIADICKGWPSALPPSLHWRQAAGASPSVGIAILHVNLFYCHSIVLLTRPFFLYILNMETQRQINYANTGSTQPRPHMKMEKFSEACVIAATHTVLLVQNAFDAGYLSRRNPIVIYFLFAATLVILANEFAGLYPVDASETCIFNAISLMSYCAESSQWASRLVYIMSAFRDAVVMQKMRRKSQAAALDQMFTPKGNPHENSGTLGLDRSIPTPTPHLHPVPIHIYPGMQTEPLPENMGPQAASASASASTPGDKPSHPSHAPNIANPPNTHTASSITLPNSPLPNLPNPNLPNPNLLTPNPDPISRPTTSLSNFLDLPALEATRVPSLHSEESFGTDEQIDFDALWAWPGNTPAVGSPQLPRQDALDAMMQGISDSSVPLYGFMES